MGVVTNEFFVAGSNTAGSFFRLRPSGFSAPERPLLKPRQSGNGHSSGGVKHRGADSQQMIPIFLVHTGSVRALGCIVFLFLALRNNYNKNDRLNVLINSD
jgi:hypothetical protein